MTPGGVILPRMARRPKAVVTPFSRLLGSASALATLAEAPDGGKGTPQPGFPLSPSGMAAAGSVAGDTDDEEEEES